MTDENTTRIKLDFTADELEQIVAGMRASGLKFDEFLQLAHDMVKQQNQQ